MGCHILKKQHHGKVLSERVVKGYIRLFPVRSDSLHYTLGGGLLRISSDGDDRRVFWGFEIFNSETFWVGNFGRYFFG